MTDPAAAIKMGRPEVYTQEIANEICEYLAMGWSLRKIHREHDHLPAIRTVFKWLREKPEFTQQYEKAKQESADALSEDLLDIVHNEEKDMIETEDAQGNIRLQPNNVKVQRDRLRADTIKWLMSKQKPKKYGDKLDLTNAGGSFGTAAAVLFEDTETEAESDSPDDTVHTGTESETA